MTIRARMLMYDKEASNRKQELDRQQPTIPYFFLNLLKSTCL